MKVNKIDNEECIKLDKMRVESWNLNKYEHLRNNSNKLSRDKGGNWVSICHRWCFHYGSVVKNLPAIQETQVKSLGQEDTLEKGIALRYSCLENTVNRGAWRAAVPGVVKSCARLNNKRTCTHTHTHIYHGYRRR